MKSGNMKNYSGHKTIYSVVTFLWGVVVLEIDSFPDLNKGPDPSLILTTLKTDNQPYYCTTFVKEVVSVHGNELCLFGSKVFPLLMLLMLSI